MRVRTFERSARRLTMYVQRYGYYPGTASQDAAMVQAAVWPSRLRPFLGGSRQSFYCPSQDERCMWTDDGPQPLKRATDITLLRHYGYEPGEPLVHELAYFSYGYNMHGVDYEPGTPEHSKGLGAYVRPDPGFKLLYGGERAASKVKVPAE